MTAFSGSAAKLALVPRTVEDAPSAGPSAPLRVAQDDNGLERIAENTCSLLELAEVLGISESAVYARAARDHWVTEQFPSQKQTGKFETRVFIKPSFSKDLLRRLRRFRRGKEREEQNLAPHPGGLVVRSDDGRVKMTPQVQQTVWALYARREQPGFEWVFEQLMDKCPFCEKGKMALARRGFDARYKSARCGHCRQSVSYQSVRRACIAMPPLLATAARQGWNAVANKHLYRGQIQRGEFRNAIVVGDHHVCDIYLWDPRRPFHSTGKPRLIRYWLSAWQDEATGVIEFALGDRPNVRLILEALYRYALRFGMPAEIRTDNGKDYLSKEFLRFWQASGIEYQHKSLPSCRTGESHGKSKVIERWFGTFERDVSKYLPGWCGSHPKERPDDVLWPQLKAHKEFLDSASSAVKTPFLTVQQFGQKIREWVEGVFHRRETERLKATPLEAFEAGTALPHTLTRDALMVLMLHPESRVIHPNGVAVNGINYWAPEFAHYKGETCDVRVDFQDLSSVVAIVGKERRVLVAEADDPAVRATQPSEEQRKQVFARKKVERAIIRSFFDLQQERLAGRRPWDAILEEKATEAGQIAMAVNGAFTPSITVLTEGDHIARQLGNREQGTGNRMRGMPARPKPDRPEDEDFGGKPAPLRLVPEDWAQAARPPGARPIFTTQWEREQWEREHGGTANGDEETSSQSDGVGQAD